MKKYLTRRFFRDIEVVDNITRETLHRVYFLSTRGDERWENKRTDLHCYHDSWQEAREYVIARANTRLRNAQQALDIAQTELARINAIPEQEPEA